MGISGKNIIKDFGFVESRVLHGIDVEINDGDFVSISGRSGSGKSTLLYILSTLDFPTEGQIFVDGNDPALLHSKELHHYRNKNIGFIFQFHYLLPELTGLENVLLGPRNLSIHKEKKEYALHLLDRFGVYSERDKIPSKMSGGQQQRVAIARALALDPKYIFADEPTGNLDSENGLQVMQILSEINRNKKTTIILVTHDKEYAKMANREIHLKDGVIVDRQNLDE